MTTTTTPPGILTGPECTAKVRGFDDPWVIEVNAYQGYERVVCYDDDGDEHVVSDTHIDGPEVLELIRSSPEAHRSVAHWHAEAVEQRGRADRAETERDNAGRALLKMDTACDAVIAEMRDEVNTAKGERDTLRAEVAELRAVLSSLEWSGFTLDEHGQGEPYCPTCEGVKPSHRDGCALDAVLAKHGVPDA